MSLNRLYEISRQLNLGPITEPPRRLTGGFLHSMFSLFTDRGKYAVKLLNPHIMTRPDAPDNFLRAEKFETLLEHANIPILPAKGFDGRKMQKIDGQFFYVFDWFDGHALPSSEVCEEHCRKIASQLARIHSIDRRQESFEYQAEEIDWEYYIKQLAKKDPESGALLTRRLDILQTMEARARSAYAKLPQVSVICHNDMDCKNVLWNGSTFRIIDLECLDWGNPALELYETALCWSGFEQCRIDSSRFNTFMRAYEEAGGELPCCWNTVHDANCGRLHWLIYNIRRTLGIGCSDHEVAIGENEIRKTIPQLVYYNELREKLN